MLIRLDDNKKVITIMNMPDKSNINDFIYVETAKLGDYYINEKVYTPPTNIAIPVVAKDGSVTWIDDPIAVKEKTRKEVLAKLHDLDIKSTRPLRAVMAAGVSQ